MKKVLVVSIFSLILVISPFVVTLFSELVFDECGLFEEDAREKAIEYLDRKRLQSESLKLEGSRGTCYHGYSYQTESQDIIIDVFSTWTHGVKITIHDKNKEGRG